MRAGVRVGTMLMAGVILCSFARSTQAESGSTKLLRYPDIHDHYVVFSYADDLWIADRDGGNPRRLTVDVGSEAGGCFSPDGKWVAFTGEYDGNVDVFIVSPEGGNPIRLTFHPEADVVRGWTPDGKVMFLSTRDSETYRYGKLFTVSVNGGLPEQVVLPRVSRASFSPDGKKIAYTMVGDPFTTWKHYRGGLTPFIWLFDLASHHVVEVPRKTFTDQVTGGTTYANDTWPVWLGDTVYFLSDRDYTMNVFAFNAVTGEVKQLTDHQDYDVKSLKGFKNTLVYEQAGMIHQLDTRTGKSTPIDVYIDPDLPETRPHFEDVSQSAQWFEISPTGKRGLFEARGDVWTVPAEKGDPRNITHSPAVNDRYPLWSADGAKIAWMSDASGEYRMMISGQMGQDEPTVYKLGPDGFYFLISWDPKSKKILFTDNQVSLFYYDLDANKAVKVAEDRFDASVFEPKWSPDGRYITFSTNLSNQFSVVKIYDTESGETQQVSDGMSAVGSPAFSRDGKYLFFASSTNVGLNVNGSEMSSYDRPMTESLYLTVLQADSTSPFAPESDEEEVAKDEDKSKDEENDKDEEKADEEEEKEESSPAIDFEGIGSRIVALPADEGVYYNLQAGDDEVLFYMDSSGDESALMKFSMEDREAKEFLSGVNNYMVSADGKKIIYAGDGSYGIVGVSDSPSPGDGSLDMSGMQVQVQPREEWRQMVREAWRLERDFFYDKNMHGLDWNGIWKKYEPFIQFIGDREDVNFIIGEMIGELVVGHAYRWGGDFPDVKQVSVGLLGANYSRENGYYRFKKIFSGLNWSPDERSPLQAPGVDVREGDYLLAVNGQELHAGDNVFAFFQNTAGKQTVLKINDQPTMDGAREVTVEPLSSERGLRLRDWVESNRQKVWDATGGRAAYVYIPDTAGDGYQFFTRYYFSQLDKQAVIIDERFNGGGHIADFVVDMLDRPLLNFWTDRAGTFGHTPTASIYGPKVMIANESAGSGGDWLPFAFKKRNLGPLVGTRTWGGLVGIGGIPDLMDGGAVTVPNFAFFNVDGTWGVEDYGVAPDIFVQQTPKEVIDGKDPQLDKAIEVINDLLKDYDAPQSNPEPRPKRAAR